MTARPATIRGPYQVQSTGPAQVLKREQIMAAKGVRKAAASRVAAKLSLDDLKKLLELAKYSHSVELKVSVPMPEHRATIVSIGLDPVEAQLRQVFFFDTPNLDLNRAGLIVRARRRQGGGGDTVVKLRPVDPATLKADLKRSNAIKIEVDATADGSFVCSASNKGVVTGQAVLDVASGAAPVRSLFTKGQIAFYAAHAPAGIDLDSLQAKVPIFTLRAKHRSKEYKRGITVEVWMWHDGTRVLEISTKCLPAEAFQVGAEFKAYLLENGIDVDAVQDTKTRTAMQKFRAAPKARRPARKSGKAARRRA